MLVKGPRRCCLCVQRFATNAQRKPRLTRLLTHRYLVIALSSAWNSLNPREPLVFAIDNPARVAMDFPGVKLKAPKKSQNIGVGLHVPWRPSRLLAERGWLAKLVPYTLSREGTVVMTLQSAEASAATL